MAQIQGSEVFAFVECRDISKAYRQGREKVQALEKVSLKILPSQAVAVVGPSGCGKTTLLNIIGCLLAPDSGTLLIKGHEPKRTDKTLSRLRNSTFGYIRQDYALIGTETVGHNVSIPLEYAVPKVKRADRRSRVFLRCRRSGWNGRYTVSLMRCQAGNSRGQLLRGAWSMIRRSLLPMSLQQRWTIKMQQI